MKYKVKMLQFLIVLLFFLWMIFFFFPMTKQNIAMYGRIRMENKNLQEWREQGFSQSGDLQKKAKELSEEYKEREEQFPPMILQEDILKLMKGLEVRTQISFQTLTFNEANWVLVQDNAKVHYQQVEVSFVGDRGKVQALVDAIQAIHRPTKIDHFAMNYEEDEKIRGSFAWIFFGFEGAGGKEGDQWESSIAF